jgi:hypothetical protein
MLDCMDGHTLLGHIALCAPIVGDGGPRHYRRRGKPLPEKYLPGRFLASLLPEARADLVRAVNEQTSPPAPWFLRLVVDEEEPIARWPDPPVDRRWCRHGRWSTPASSTRRTRGQAPSGAPIIVH